MSKRDRMRRVIEGLEELDRGNYAHRIIMPGNDEPARMAELVNRVADAIQAQRDSATAADLSRRRLLADISHDLRTPITSIAGYVDALQRGIGEQPDRYLCVLAQKSAELARLTDDLFYSARIDAQDLELAATPLDLVEAIRRALLGFEQQLTASGVDVLLALPEGPRRISADPSALNRVLSNLFGNAVQHGDRMTRLSVAFSGAEAPRPSYVVRVSNDGGSLPDDPERLFERGAIGTRGGTGLGLAIARELVERMHGTVSAEPGEGVTLVLVFPALEE